LGPSPPVRKNSVLGDERIVLAVVGDFEVDVNESNTPLGSFQSKLW